MKGDAEKLIRDPGLLTGLELLIRQIIGTSEVDIVLLLVDGGDTVEMASMASTLADREELLRILVSAAMKVKSGQADESYTPPVPS